MNSVERILKTLSYEETDRPPVLPILLLQGARLLNIELEEYLSKPEHLIKGQEALLEKFGYDGVFGIPHIVEDIEPFGGELLYFKSGPPSVKKMAWKDWGDLDFVSVPDPKKSTLLVNTLKTIETLANKFKGEKLIIGGGIAPFSLPSMLIGTEKWFELLWEDELISGPILKKVLNITKEFCIKWANLQFEAGADVVVLGDGMASATCIVREQFEKLALQNLKETINSINGTIVYEPIGQIQPFLDLFLDIGVSVVIVSCQDDIEKCKTIANKKISLMGNLNNIEMLRWDRKKTLEMSIDALNKGAKDGGFILSSQGPEVPWGVQDEVIEAMVDSIKIWQK